MVPLIKYLTWLTDYREYMEETPQLEVNKNLFFFVSLIVNSALSVFIGIVVTLLITILISTNFDEGILMFEELSLYFILIFVVLGHIIAILYDTFIRLREFILDKISY